MICLSTSPVFSVRAVAPVVVPEAAERCILCAAMLVFLLGAAAVVLRAISLATVWV